MKKPAKRKSRRAASVHLPPHHPGGRRGRQRAAARRQADASAAALAARRVAARQAAAVDDRQALVLLLTPFLLVAAFLIASQSTRPYGRWQPTAPLPVAAPAERPPAAMIAAPTVVVPSVIAYPRHNPDLAHLTEPRADALVTIALATDPPAVPPPPLPRPSGPLVYPAAGPDLAYLLELPASALPHVALSHAPPAIPPPQVLAPGPLGYPAAAPDLAYLAEPPAIGLPALELASLAPLVPLPPDVTDPADGLAGQVCPAPGRPPVGAAAARRRSPQALAAVPPPEEFGARLAEVALESTRSLVIYSARYEYIRFPMGDISPMYGACSDLVIRAYRALGVDLQQLVRQAGVGSGDASIDHRRTETLRRLFARHGESLPVSEFPEDYRPGDIVTYYRPFSRVSRAHIAIVSNVLAPTGRPMIIHNRGWGPQIEDALFVDRITGHYRFSGLTGVSQVKLAAASPGPGIAPGKPARTADAPAQRKKSPAPLASAAIITP